MISADAPQYLQGNVDGWQDEAANYVEAAEEAWASDEPYWGIWKIPNSEVTLLPHRMSGMQCIELGCGTAYVSAWMARRGAQVTAIDPTPNQLQTARRLRHEYTLDFTIQDGFAEKLPFQDQSFNFAISEYGASLWSDPNLWIPEANRILKMGGVLTFLTNAPLMVLCTPEYDAGGSTQTQLLRPYFGMREVQWPDTPDQTEFHLPHGKWVELLRANGFAIEQLLELRAPARSTSRYTWADPEWARQWPSEEVWVARKEKDVPGAF